MQHRSSNRFLQISAALTLSLLSYCCFNPSFANAQTTATSSNPFLCPGGGVDCLIAGYGVNQQSWLVQPVPDQEQSMAAGSVLDQLFSLAGKNARPLTIQDVIMGLTTIDTKKTNIEAANLPALLTAPAECQKSILGTCANNPKADAEDKASNFSLDSLLGPISYKSSKEKDEAKNAKNFILWVSNLADPVPALDYGSINPTQAQNLPDVAKYLVMQRTYVAEQSVGLSNLYHFYAERMPEKGLGNKAGINVGPDTSQSPLEVEKYLATRQVTDPQWFTSMQNASPAAVSRATLFMLAELPPMLYQIHLDLERLTTTMSVLEMQQARSNNVLLSQQMTKAQTALTSVAKNQH